MCLHIAAHGILRDDQVKQDLSLDLRSVLRAASPLLYDPSFCPFENLEREIESGGRQGELSYLVWRRSFLLPRPSMVANGHGSGVGFFLGLEVFSGARRRRAKSDSFSEQIRPRTVDKKTRAEERERRRVRGGPTYGHNN